MSGPRCAFLTIPDLSDFVSDDELAAAVLREQGWQVAAVPWSADEDWSRYDAAVIRTTWDYQAQPRRFLQRLQAIERSGALLLNPLSLVRWNIDKRYLADLERRGVPIVPTRYAQRLATREQIADHFRAFATGEIIVKPQIGANAGDTFHLRSDALDAALPPLLETFAARPYLAQPFMENVRAEGEYSLIYLDRRLSHAILKTPKAGDFRVQEEFGGLIAAVDPTEELIRAGGRVLDALDKTPLYARVDLVRDDDGRLLLMELELIEPSLYLRMDPGAPQRFADAIAAAVGGIIHRFHR